MSCELCEGDGSYMHPFWNIHVECPRGCGRQGGYFVKDEKGDWFFESEAEHRRKQFYVVGSRQKPADFKRNRKKKDWIILIVLSIWGAFALIAQWRGW
jgi:hypothetical protein